MKQFAARAVRGWLRQVYAVFIRVLLVLSALFGSACQTTKPADDDAPTATPPKKPPATETIHIVEKGDTLYSIARKYSATVDDIVEVNGLVDGNTLSIGQRLVLPIGHSRSDAPSTLRPPTDRFAWPVDSGVVLREFSTKVDQKHEGLVIAAPFGTPVLVAHDGIVVFVDEQDPTFGSLVIVQQTRSKLLTVYGHLDRVFVQAEDVVKMGEKLGVVGVRGGAESPRIFFQVRREKIPVDPLLYLEDP